ncbi:lipopolysaccharide biosynthesis protein [Schaalia cardiffensis F0333]|uniref:Lipopolysaccharide biosynthesis protein n=1 Tax=Schaalia cardiffensis F0333 TaxID=888050 RepID=N6W8V1_9ACTO|nr:nucleotide sugar dehydrogenase [Schaalia cardiffensis]ENO18990.1 lipopolysaccharide biosynthesis protein [Schaalia cardiffensis F0333]
MRIAVVALGKIGLPLAVQFASKGHEVIGVDVSKRRVELVNEAKEPFPGEARLQELLSEAVTSGRLRATTDYGEAIPDAEAVILVVPLVVDEDSTPDFRWMDAATSSLAEHLSANTIVSYETTLPVGTTRERWKPMIEEISGLKEGRDFHLVFSPERVLSGRVFADLRRYPKLVGGLNESGTAAGIALYEQLLDFDERADLPRGNGVWDMGSAEAAELAKLAETTYRDVNIALVNQFAIFADRAGIDIYTVIEACNSQPYSHLHRPGIAVGGHCIPVYPRLYLSSDPDADVVSTARAANAAMPEYVVSKLAELLGDLRGLRIAVLGAAYRGGVKETAFSGVFATVDALRHRGALVLVNDPLYTDEELKNFGWVPYHFGDEVDAAIIQADHEEYAGLEPADLPGVRILFDGRAISDPVAWKGVPRLLVGKGC